MMPSVSVWVWGYNNQEHIRQGAVKDTGQKYFSLCSKAKLPKKYF